MDRDMELARPVAEAAARYFDSSADDEFIGNCQKDIAALLRSVRGEWLPIESAPKGGGVELVTDLGWIEPPRILLLFPDNEISVGRWDWYYAEGGVGFTDGIAWVEPVSGELIHRCLSGCPPIGWMPLPSPPEA